MLPGRNCPGNPAEELQSPALAQILVTQAPAMMLVRLVSCRVPRDASGGTLSYLNGRGVSQSYDFIIASSFFAVLPITILVFSLFKATR